ncbi:MAG: LemA family protein [Planctomycetota bacterium]|nr:MAG: LemA family protein [Planctomycetota bacterium]
MIAVWILIGVIIVMVLWCMGAHNKLVRLRNNCENSWSQIDVQLKRRHDLIPNLVETCKGYMKHERETLENVIKARQQAVNVSGANAGNIKEVMAAENFLTQTLRSLFALTENYPDLKANTNMQELMEELTNTENKISFARQHYNDCVMVYNTAIETIPTNIVANMMNFTKKDFFEIADPTERENVKVQF